MINLNRALVVLTLVICGLIPAFGQNDSIQEQAQDSILAEQQVASDSLIAEARRSMVADSLERARLLEQLAEVRASDQAEKDRIKAQIDSLQKAQLRKVTRIQREADSLRAVTKGVPVIVFGDTLFQVYSKLGPNRPRERANDLVQEIEFLVDEGQFDPAKIRVVDGEDNSDIYHDENPLYTVTTRDAIWLGKERGELARAYAGQLSESYIAYKERTSLPALFKRLGWLVLTILLFFFGIKYLNKGLKRFNLWVVKRADKYMTGVRLKDYEFLSKSRQRQLVLWTLNLCKWILIVLLVYIALPIIFSIFPATEGIARTLISYILDPLSSFWNALVEFVPNLITIAVIIFLTHHLVRFLRFLSEEVRTEKLEIPGFYPDWAKPTFNLVRILVNLFAFIVIFPYLPGSDSPIFRGISVFLGLLISLGSSSAIGNIIAGLVITYMRAFRIGDRVKIGDTTGDVIEKSLLVTRVRTIKNEEVTIPNSFILNGSTINYTAATQERGLILNTAVTIGYDVPWRDVHELLISAAIKTDLIMDEPKPFVFQTGLDDFYVSYQINAYTQRPEKAAAIYSDLHANIQDAFNEAGVEILSPHYRAARDGNMVTIPASYLPPDYSPPSFRVESTGKKTKN
jgi:small-conductance mechanosensitive channel